MAKENDWQGALAAIELTAIDSLKQLKQEQDVLDERVRNMDGLKSSVADAVYLRVLSDYQARQRALEDQAAPLKLAAREQYAKLRELLARFEAAHDAVKLDEQEIELRHKLGEFDDKEYAKRIKTIEALVKEKGEAHSTAQQIKAQFLSAFHSESDLESDPTPVRSRQTPRASSVVSEVTTNEMPIVEPPPPDRTQIMAAINIPDPPAPPLPRAASPPAVGGATLMFRTARLVPQNPEAGKNSYALSLKPTLIGADSVNDVRVGGPGVDPKHAQITVSMSGFTLVDMGSKHGTRVNAEKVRERLLRHEDVIQIGAARFVFRES
jgi:FHA domain